MAVHVMEAPPTSPRRGDRRECENPADEDAPCDKITKRDFITRVAETSGQPGRVVSTVYESIIATLVDAVTDGEIVELTGFGSFRKQYHQGHKVRFGRSSIGAYTVMRFKASRATNRRINVSKDPPGEPIPLMIQ